MPDNSCSTATAKSTVVGGKANTKKSVTAGNSARRPGRGDRDLGGTPGSKLRTPAHAARRDSAHLKHDAETWKTKYEELLTEVQKAQTEKETAKRDFDKHIAELNDNLVANENCRQQADTELAKMAEQLANTHANMELCRQQTRDLEYTKEELSTQFSSACSLIQHLEPQAKLAGELQTELNSLRNVRVPFLEQENRALKHKLLQLLEDAETLSSAHELATSRSQARQCDEHGDAETLRDLLREDQGYIEQLEYTCGWLGTGYAKAIFEMDGRENKFATLQSAAGHLEEQHDDVVFRENPLMQDSGGFETEKRVLRIVNAGTATISTASTISVPSTSSGVAAAVQACARKPLSMSFEGLTDPEAGPPLRPILCITAVSTIAIQPVACAPVRTPRAPLDRDLQITIQIEPTDYSKLSLLERLKAVTTLGTSFQIHGPAEIAKALAHAMEDSHARATHNEAKLLELQKLTWSKVAEMERMKRAACTLAEHKTLGDELAAMEARLVMQDMLLADYGRQLAQFKRGLC
jgi:hypothetical protein